MSMRLRMLQSLGRVGSRQKLVPATTRLIPSTSNIDALRWNSSAMPEAYKYINIKPDVQKGVSILEMKKPPVNSLSLDFLTEINIALEKLENDRTVRGVIITSACPVFSAGLDILEMHEPEPERLKLFWHNIQEMTLGVFSSSKVYISAIDGPCIAGGCIFAWGSDYRIMSEGKHTIGLNETKLGLAAPVWLADLAKRNMGLRNAEKMLQLGELYPAREALTLGMIDEVCPQGKALDMALEKMQQWMLVADSGRIITKQSLRKDFIESMQRLREEDNKTFCAMVNLDNTQKLLKQYVAALKGK